MTQSISFHENDELFSIWKSNLLERERTYGISIDNEPPVHHMEEWMAHPSRWIRVTTQTTSHYTMKPVGWCPWENGKLWQGGGFYNSPDNICSGAQPLDKITFHLILDLVEFLRQLTLWGTFQPLFNFGLLLQTLGDTATLRITGLWEKNPPARDGFYSQRINNAESVSIPWCHEAISRWRTLPQRVWYRDLHLTIVMISTVLLDYLTNNKPVCLLGGECALKCYDISRDLVGHINWSPISENVSKSK